MIAFDIISKTIANKANEYCERSDGYEEEIEKLTLRALIEAYNYGIEAAAIEANNYSFTGTIEIRKLKK